MRKGGCHECGLKLVLPVLKEKQKAICPRCSYTLTAKHKNAAERTLAFSITALIFLVISLCFNFLTFKSNGIERTINLLTSIDVLIQHNYSILAGVVILCVFIFPCLILLGFIYLLSFMRFNLYPPSGMRISRFIFALLPWHMAEIFIISTLVSLIKIIALADITLGLSFYTFIAFSVSLIFALLHVDQKEWALELTGINKDNVTENEVPNNSGNNEMANIASIQRTWALLLTSVLLYIPANIFPIMNTRLLGQDEPSTIIGGVLLLWHHGSYPIAIIIFIASVLVPVSKLLILAWLNYSVQMGSQTLQRKRMKWYRIAEFVGRWSMVDIFVVIILVSLVQLGNSMMVLPGYATIAFLAVVVLTMIAAMTFDSRLIYKERNDSQ